MTIATGSGDLTDLVTCYECGKQFKAYILCNLATNINVTGKHTKIRKVYTTNQCAFSEFNKENNE